MLGSLLKALVGAVGAEEARSRWASTGLQLAAVLPADKRESAEELQKLVNEYELADVVA